MDLYSLLFALTSAIIIYIFFRNQRKKSLPNGTIPIPGPKPLPIIGNLHQMKTLLDFQGYVDKLTDEYGPIFQIHLGAKTWIIINDYEILRDLLVKRGTIYSSRPFSHATTRIYFNGGKTIGFAPYGKYWRAMRTIFHKAVTQKVVDNNYRDIIHTEIKNLSIKFFNHNSKGFNPTEDTSSSLIDLLATIAYGKKPEKLSKKIAQMSLDFNKVLNPVNSLMDLFPWLKYIPFIDKKVNSYPYKARSLVREISTQLLDDLRQRLKVNEDENSFAAQVIKNMSISPNVVTKPYEDTLENDGEEEFVFDEMDFMSLNNSLIISGSSTTIDALRWIWALLVNHPEVQRKIQKELDECLQGNRFPSPQDDLKLPYLCATIKESLRYRPARNFLLEHSTTKDDVYRGYFIPAKSIVFASFKTAHTSEKLFERPNEFYPEHYLDEDGQLKKNDELRDPWAFGKGRRSCAGQHLAERNLITAVGYMLTLFNVENDIDPITGNPIKIDLKYAESKLEPYNSLYKIRFVPRPGVTLEKIKQMN